MIFNFDLVKVIWCHNENETTQEMLSKKKEMKRYFKGTSNDTR